MFRLLFRSHSILLVALSILLNLACGGSSSTPQPSPQPLPLEIAQALRATPGVAAVAERASGLAGTRFFELTFTQYVDHRNPATGTFPQTVTLLYRSRTAPMVLASSGYGISRNASQGEPTRLLSANQLSVEHRYFAPSAPTPLDWRYLDIFQAASDHHRIVQALRPLFPGRWLSTGGSKGGETSVFHRRFFPEDVDATLAYVAPICLGNPDPRFIPFVDSRGGEATRIALEQWQQAVLDHRTEVRTLLERDAAGRGSTLALLGSDKALEFALLEATFILWQYGNASLAAQVPFSGASPEQLYAYLDTIYGGVVANMDDDALSYYAPYYHQSATQLGYPDTKESHLRGLAYPRQDLPGNYPPLGVPKVYDGGAALRDIQDWVRSTGTQMMFVYGENDPWSAGAYEVPTTRDNRIYWVPAGNHGSRLSQLPEPQRSEAYATLSRWMGAPVIPAAYLEARKPVDAAFDGSETFVQRRTRP